MTLYYEQQRLLSLECVNFGKKLLGCTKKIIWSAKSNEIIHMLVYIYTAASMNIIQVALFACNELSLKDSN